MSKRERQTRHRRTTATVAKECYCGKRGFQSRNAAKRSMSKAGNKIRLYLCPESGLWHVTSQLDDDYYEAS